MDMTTTDTLVIGAGQAGLAAAHHLGRAGTASVILNASASPAGSWPRYYDSLTLFSPARFSQLPGLGFSGDPDRYPHRDEVVDYLTRYASRLDADIRYQRRVTSLTQTADGLAARGDGFEVRAHRVIVASGSFDAPYTPPIPGIDAHGGRVLHVAQYRSPGEFAGARIAIFGAGNSAVQIAAELATVARVDMYSRHPIRWQRQRILGEDLHWWLVRTGLDRAGVLDSLFPVTTPVLDDGRYRAALRRAAVGWNPMPVRIQDGRLVGVDGRRREADVLLFATGYRPSVSFLASTPALDSTGLPRHRAGISTTVPGLGFVGLEHQRSFASATLRGVGRDAQAVVSRLMQRPQNDHAAST